MKYLKMSYTRQKLIFYPVLFVFLLTSAFADQICPSCSFVNLDEDIYCLGCASQMRERTAEEKKIVERRAVSPKPTNDEAELPIKKYKPRAILSYELI